MIIDKDVSMPHPPGFKNTVDYWLEWWKQKQREYKLIRIIKGT